MTTHYSTTAGGAELLDEYLVLATRSGDRAAGERLAARWYPRLLRTARRLLGDEEAARDAVQDCWIAVARGLPRLDDASRFPAWAFRILHRRCSDQLRLRYRQRANHQSLDDRDGSTPSRGEQHYALDAAFAGLSEAHRAVAVLFYGEGLGIAAIATAVGAPPGTVKSRLFHARRHLKSLLEGASEGDTDD